MKIQADTTVTIFIECSIDHASYILMLIDLLQTRDADDFASDTITGYPMLCSAIFRRLPDLAGAWEDYDGSAVEQLDRLQTITALFVDQARTKLGTT